MTYAAAPARTELADTYPAPSNAIFKVGVGKLWDMVTGLLGVTGNPEDALAALKLLDPQTILNLKPTFTVAANVLTITMKDKDAIALSASNPGYLSQRHATIGDGGFLLRKVTTALTMNVSSGSTLGHASGRLRPIYIYLLDNSGTQELAVAGSFQGESGLFTTVAEGGIGAADSAGVMYSTTARTNFPGRLIAIAWSNQTAAGSWAAVPVEVKQAPFDLRQVGEVINYLGGAVTYGHHLMDATNVSRTTYAKLFGAVDTNGGVGDGSTTFGVGDSRRRTLVGSGGTGSGTLGNAVGNSGGSETHPLVVAELAAHSHPGSTTTLPYHALTGGPAYGSAAVGNDSASGVTVASQGSGTPHNNIQPSLVVTQMIRWIGDIA